MDAASSSYELHGPTSLGNFWCALAQWASPPAPLFFPVTRVTMNTTAPVGRFLLAFSTSSNRRCRFTHPPHIPCSHAIDKTTTVLGNTLTMIARATLDYCLFLQQESGELPAENPAVRCGGTIAHVDVHMHAQQVLLSFMSLCLAHAGAAHAAGPFLQAPRCP
jgi:hypothetical protein